jgi:hypothetical protein
MTSELFTLATFFAAVSVSVMKFWNDDRSFATQLQQEIHFARKHVALAHLRPGAHLLLEALEIGFRLAGQPDENKSLDLEAQHLGVEIGVIAANVSRLLQRAHAAQAGRRGDLRPA